MFVVFFTMPYFMVCTFFVAVILAEKIQYIFTDILMVEFDKREVTEFHQLTEQ